MVIKEICYVIHMVGMYNMHIKHVLLITVCKCFIIFNKLGTRQMDNWIAIQIIPRYNK